MVSCWRSVYLSVHRMSVCPYLFSDDNLGRCQWIFTKLGVYIDIMEIWFGIVNGQISSIFDKSFLPAMRLYFHFRMITK